MFYKSLAVIFSTIAILAWGMYAAYIAASSISVAHAVGRFTGCLIWPVVIAALCMRFSPGRWQATMRFGLIAGFLGLGVLGSVVSQRGLDNPAQRRADRWYLAEVQTQKQFAGGVAESCTNSITSLLDGTPSQTSKVCETLEKCVILDLRTNPKSSAELKELWLTNALPSPTSSPQLTSIVSTCYSTAATASGLAQKAPPAGSK